MDWQNFMISVIDSEQGKGISDFVFRDTGHAYVVQRRILVPLTLPSALLSGDAFDDLLFMMVPEPRVLKGALEWEGAFSIDRFRFRCAMASHLDGRELVMRILPSIIPNCDDILLSKDLVDQFCQLSHGLVLLVGQTGSGKSTTIASLVQERARLRDERVITLEDPIEFQYSKNLRSTFTQRQIGQHAASFSTGLRLALRLKPDVIVVGEIRDPQTAEIALQAAESGHLVVSTMHTHSPDQAVQRYEKIMPAERVGTTRETLAEVLRMVIAQQLKIVPDGSRLVPLHEVLITHPESGVSSNIRNGQFQLMRGIMETGSRFGMQTFRQALEKRVDQGLFPYSILEDSH